MSSPDDFQTRMPTVSYPSERAAPVRAVTVPSNNWAAWMLAAMPIVFGFFSAMVALVLSSPIPWASVILVVAVLWAGCILLARVDRRELDAWGFENTASPWLVLLSPPVYLAVRGNRVLRRTGAGLGPFWLSVAVLLLFPVASRGWETILSVIYLLSVAKDSISG